LKIPEIIPAVKGKLHRAICAVDDLGGLASSDRAEKKQMKGDFLRWVEGLAVLTR